MQGSIVIQHIRSIWKEAARAGAGSERSGIPEAVALPVESFDPTDSGILEHRLTWSELVRRDWPAEEVTTRGALRPIQVGAVWIDPAEDVVRVTFHWETICGAPQRGWAHKRLEARPGEWVQVAYNGRFSGWGAHWWYEKTVVNVGVFASPAPDAFTGGDPADRYALFSRLW